MTRKRWMLVVLVLLLSITAFSFASAQGPPSIDRHIITSGAQYLEVADLQIVSIVGEGVVSGMVANGDVQVGTGFMQEEFGTFRRWLADMQYPD